MTTDADATNQHRKDAARVLAAWAANLSRWRQYALYLAIYTIGFAALSATVFASFWRHGRTLIWQGDGVAQHLAGLEYYRAFLREIARSIIQGHPHLPMYDFSIGMGDSVISGLFSVSNFDVINSLVVFVPKGGIEWFFIAATILRIYLAGLAFAAFGWYLKARPWAIMLGSFVYIFSGYALVAAPRHPFFAIPLLYVPLLFLGLDLLLRRKTPFALIASVFLMALTGFYFLYMCTIIMAVYAVVRLGYLYGWRNWKGIIRAGLGAAAGYAVGLMMAAVAFLPILKNTVNSNRTGTSTLPALADFVPIPKDSADAAVFAFSPRPSWDYLGLSGAVLLALCAVLACGLPRRKRRYILVFAGTLALIYLLPLGGLVMNGFGYASNRWTFLLAFFGAALLTYMLPRMLSLHSWPFAACCVLALASYGGLIAILTPSYGTATKRAAWAGLVCLTLLVVTIVLGWLLTSRVPGRAGLGAGAFFALIVCAGLITNATILYGTPGYEVASEYVRFGTTAARYAKAVAPGKVITKADPGFYRIDDAQPVTPNIAMLGRYHGISSYLSTSNGTYLKGWRDLELSSLSAVNRVSGLNGRAALEALTAVKYKVVTEKAPPPAPSYGPPSKVPATVAGKTIEQNSDALPLGYVYRRSIPAAQWDALAPLDKQEALLQAAVIADGASSNASELAYTSRQIPYTARFNDATWSDGVINVKRAGGGVTLNFVSPPGAETYLRIEGFRHTSTGSGYLDIESDGDQQVVRVYGTETNYYFPRPGILVNLGSSKSKRTSVTIAFREKASYRLSGLKMYTYPLSSLGTQVAVLGAEPLANVTYRDNALTGTVASAAGGTLVLTVPYDKGWTTKVDGVETSAVQANASFTGVHLTSGEHRITMTYRWPWLTQGAVLSAVGAIICIAMIIVRMHARASQRKRRDAK